MRSLILIAFLFALTMVLFSCGYKVEHSGKVDVKVDIDFVMLEALCKEQLGIADIPTKNLSQEDSQALAQCQLETYFDLLEAVQNNAN